MIKKEKVDPKLLMKLKCMVCNSMREYRSSYKYKQTLAGKIFTKLRKKKALRFSLDVPVCSNCKKKFHMWSICNNLLISIFIFGITGVIFGIFFLVFHQIFNGLGVQIIIFGFLIILFSLIFRYSIGRIKVNPNNYFFYDFIGKTFYVKPMEEKDWIPFKVWITSIIGKK